VRDQRHFWRSRPSAWLLALDFLKLRIFRRSL